MSRENMIPLDESSPNDISEDNTDSLSSKSDSNNSATDDFTRYWYDGDESSQELTPFINAIRNGNAIIHYEKLEGLLEEDLKCTMDLCKAAEGTEEKGPYFLVHNLCVLLRKICASEKTILLRVAEAWHVLYNRSPPEATKGLLQLLLYSTYANVRLTRQRMLHIEEHCNSEFNKWVDMSPGQRFILDNTYMLNLKTFLNLILTDRIFVKDEFLMKNIEDILKLCVNSVWPVARYTACILGDAIAHMYLAYLREMTRGSVDDDVILRKKNKFESFLKLFLNFVIMTTRDAKLNLRKLACNIYFNWLLMKEPLLMIDTYLRHLYWSVYDESPVIRKLSIECFGSLIKEEKMIGIKKYDQFIKKMVTALAHRVQDDSTQVAISAVKAVTEIHRQAPNVICGYFKHEMSIVYSMIFCAEPTLTSYIARFIVQVLKNSSSSNQELLETIVIFVNEILGNLEDCNRSLKIKKEKAVSLFVKNIFEHFHMELTNWEEWKVLLTNTEDFAELKCLIFVNIIAEVSFCAAGLRPVELEVFPGIPESETKTKSNQKRADKKLKKYCLEHLENLISIIGPALLGLWSKYEKNARALAPLVSIPQYFDGRLDSYNVEVVCHRLSQLRTISPSSSTLTAIHRTLVSIYDSMLGSDEWKSEISIFESIVFEVTHVFLQACSNLSEEEENMKIIKVNSFLSKFFDVTKTPLLDDAFKGLKLAITRDKIKIVCPTAMICLYVIQWQLRKLQEESISDDEKTNLQHKIQSQSSILFNHLEVLLRNKNESVRKTASGVMCRLLTMLCPTNKYAASFPLIHLPPLNATVSEWLYYSLHCQISFNQMQRDEESCEDAKSALRLFCNVLISHMIHLNYIIPVLRFFRLHKKLNNYNDVLAQFFWKMNKVSEDFLHVVMDGLFYFEFQSDSGTQEIAKGIINVISKNMPKEDVQKVALEFVTYGLSKVHSERHHFIFLILSEFVTSLKPKDALRIHDQVKTIFCRYCETRNVKCFLEAFSLLQKTHFPGSSEQASTPVDQVSRQ